MLRTMNNGYFLSQHLLHKNVLTCFRRSFSWSVEESKGPNLLTGNHPPVKIDVELIMKYNHQISVSLYRTITVDFPAKSK